MTSPSRVADTDRTNPSSELTLSGSALRRNIELKAHLRDAAGARRTAEGLATERLGVQYQKDTYFRCPYGRLKLREIKGTDAQLIWYDRPDVETAKASQYHLATVNDPAGLKTALTAALGLRVVITKVREIFLYHNVRIHLDEVERLGQFLELEAVLGGHVDDRQGHEQLRFLSDKLGIAASDLITNSYGELLEDHLKNSASCEAVAGRPGDL